MNCFWALTQPDRAPITVVLPIRLSGCTMKSSQKKKSFMTLDKCRKVCKGISAQIFGKFTKYVFVAAKEIFRKKIVENNETTILRAMYFSRKYSFS